MNTAEAISEIYQSERATQEQIARDDHDDLMAAIVAGDTSAALAALDRLDRIRASIETLDAMASAAFAEALELDEQYYPGEGWDLPCQPRDTSAPF